VEQFVHYPVLIALNCCFVPLIWAGIIRSTDQNVCDLVLDLLIESSTEFHNNPESFHVARLVYELSEVIDILVDSAFPLVVSCGLKFCKGKLGFILQAELSNEGFMEGFPGGVFGGL
jgi:heterodisulfide reductase subunit B